MKRHAKEYLILLEELEVNNAMLTGYVDDTVNALAGIDPGVRFEDGKLVRKEELVQEDNLIPEYQRTMTILKEVADTVFKCVQFTVDSQLQIQKNQYQYLT